MKRILLLGIALVLVIAPVVIADQLQDYINAGLAVFQNDEVVVTTQSKLQAAIDSFLAAYKLDPTNKLVLNKLSQCYYTLADAFLTDKNEQIAAYKEGQRYGEESLRANPNFVAIEKKKGGGFIAAVEQTTDEAALYWTYANWARKDEFDKLGAIMRNDSPKLLALIEQALKVDPSYLVYGPYRSLGAFWGGLPKLPFGKFRQNLNKAKDYLCKVVNDPENCSGCTNCPIDPAVNEYFENRLFYAQYYLMPARKWAQAKKVLEEIINADPGTKYPLYNPLCQKRAQALLVEVNKHLK